MTRKEVQRILDTNPGKGLYIEYTCRSNVGEIVFCDPVSKSRLFKAAKYITRAEDDIANVLFYADNRTAVDDYEPEVTHA